MNLGNRTLRNKGDYLYLLGVTPHQRKVAATVSKLLAWYPHNARDLPWRRTNDPYCVFVSEIMLQQTQVKTVVPYYQRWMGALPEVSNLARARPDRLRKLWEGLGYYRRVVNLQRAARLIVEKHGGRFPRTHQELLELPGIGRYTAGAICSIAFHQPEPVLDGNVTRVLCRLFGIEGDPQGPESKKLLWRLARELVEQAGLQAAKRLSKPARSNGSASAKVHPVSALNQSLMELGALVCTAGNPKCGLCPVSETCFARSQNRVHLLPRKRPAVRAVPRRFMAFLLERNGRWLVRQRPEGVVNARFWEFPNAEVLGQSPNPKYACRDVLGRTPVHCEPLCSIKHTITRYRITLEAFTVQISGRGKPTKNSDRWLGLSQLHRLPLTSAHEKVLRALQFKAEYRAK